MNKYAVSILALCAVLALPVSAHEGHDHAPGVANHGGVVKDGKTISVEFVARGLTLEVHPRTADGKEIPVKDVKIKATVQAPKKRPIALDLKPVDEWHYKGEITGEKSYRFEVKLTASYKGQDNHFVFQVEPGE